MVAQGIGERERTAYDEERGIRAGRKQLPEWHVVRRGDGGVVGEEQEPVADAEERDHLRIEGEVAPGRQRPLDEALERFGEHQADSPAPTIVAADRSRNRGSSVNKSSFAGRRRARASRPRSRI